MQRGREMKKKPSGLGLGISTGLAVVQTQIRLWSVVVTGCFLVPLLLFFLAVLHRSSEPAALSIMNLQVSIVQSDGHNVSVSQLIGSPPPATDRLPLLVDNTSSSVVIQKPVAAAEKAGGGVDTSSPAQEAKNPEQPTSTTEEDKAAQPVDDATGGTSASTASTRPAAAAKTKKMISSSIVCDFSLVRTDICELRGDVRIQGSSASVVLVTPTPPPAVRDNNGSWKIKPYARKWERTTMAQIREFSVSVRAASDEPEETSASSPRCAVHHAVPAVVFSTSGLQGNFFHDMADVLVPLYLTTHRYRGEVQLLVTQYRRSWVDKYRAVLRRLSRYEIMDVDKDGSVHCFPGASVGLRSHKELGIDPAMEPVGHSMGGFRSFLRSCYSLRREHPTTMGTFRDPASTKKLRPRLLFLSRRGSRSLLNERKVFRMARKVGFKVIVAPPEAARNMTAFAHTVNSCDVMVGVHGAGLTNMVFLPEKATLVQIVPFGEMKYPCRFPYGDPAVEQGLRYLEYEVGKQESSLIRQYPEDHPVLADPLSIHRQGFPLVWSIYIDKQNLTLDLNRFRPVLLEAMRPFTLR